MQVIEIKKKGIQSIERRHPWIFSGAIYQKEKGVEDGSIVKIVDYSGETLGYGHYQNGSIAIRMLTFQRQEPDQFFWNEQIQKAVDYRRHLGLPDKTTNAYRLIHGEGDGLPGLIIDIYNDNAVVQCHSIGMMKSMPSIQTALLEALPELKSIYDKSEKTLQQVDLENRYLIKKDRFTTIEENNVKFKIDWETGQKTGFFLDQRENRQHLGEIAAGKSVLNCFCYSGGFSMYALKYGASRVVSVDISDKATDLVRENHAINSFVDDRHSIITANVMEYLQDEDQGHDIVVVDPPAFAKSKSKRHNAVQAYKRLNMMALNSVNPGGYLFTFSCSQVVDTTLFQNTIRAAAIENGRSIRIVRTLSQGPDHPVNIYHPEGHYLKGLILYVE